MSEDRNEGDLAEERSDGSSRDAPDEAGVDGDAARDQPPGPAMPKKRRPKRRTRAARPADDTPPSADAPNASPRGVRATFAGAFPPNAALDALCTAFDRGDFASVRRGATELARKSRDEAVRAAALELRRRTEPAPLALLLLLLGLALVIFLFVSYLRRPP